jgi:hypothetical protein
MALEEERAVCLSCAKQDYTQSLPPMDRSKVDWNRIRLSYIGPDYSMRKVGKICHVSISRGSYHPLCPFACGLPMRQLKTWYRNRESKIGYTCDDGHIIYLVERGDGRMGWK